MKKAPTKKVARKKVAVRSVKKAAKKKPPAKKTPAVRRTRTSAKPKSHAATRSVHVFAAGGGTPPKLHHFETPSSGQKIAAAVGVKPAARSSLRQFISGLKAKGVLKGYIK